MSPMDEPPDQYIAEIEKRLHGSQETQRGAKWGLRRNLVGGPQVGRRMSREDTIASAGAFRGTSVPTTEEQWDAIGKLQRINEEVNNQTQEARRLHAEEVEAKRLRDMDEYRAMAAKDEQVQKLLASANVKAAVKVTWRGRVARWLGRVK